MIKKIICIFFIILSINLGSAVVETFGVFRQNNCVNLLQSCSNCTYNNISSIIYPNSSTATGQVIMSKVGKIYNYTFCNTGLMGDYIVNGFGDPDGTQTVWGYDFKVTATGTKLNTDQSILYIIVAFVSVFIFMLLMYGAIKTPWGNEKSSEGEIIAFNYMKYFKLFCMVMAYVNMVWITFLIYNITYGYENFTVASSFFNFLYVFLLSLMFPIIVLSFVISVVQFIKGKEIQSALERGIRIYDD